MKQLIRAIFFFSVFVGLALSTRAQETRGAANATTTVTLTPSQWKAVEGYYQSATNKNLYLQSIAQDSLLLIKFLWTKNADTLRPLSDLVFISKNQDGEKAARSVFVKDPQGTAISIAYSGYTWERVHDYKPVVVKEMPHMPAQLARFAGVYHAQRDSNDLIQVVVEGNDLVLKETQDIHIVPQSELSFFRLNNLWFSVDFSQDGAGKITQALIVKRDVWIRNPEPAITAAQLHSYEGSYRAKNDSDNVIQLIVHGKQLLVKQLWDGKTIEVTPLADLYFYNKAQSYSLQLVRDGDGKVRQAWLLNTTEFDRKIEN